MTTVGQHQISLSARSMHLPGRAYAIERALARPRAALSLSGSRPTRPAGARRTLGRVLVLPPGHGRSALLRVARPGPRAGGQAARSRLVGTLRVPALSVQCLLRVPSARHCCHNCQRRSQLEAASRLTRRRRLVLLPPAGPRPGSESSPDEALSPGEVPHLRVIELELPSPTEPLQL